MEIQTASAEIAAIVRQRFGNIAFAATNESRVTVPGQKGKSMGTVLIAFKYRDGVLISADKRMTEWGSVIYGDDAKKLTKVGPWSAIGCTGDVAIIQIVEDVYKQTLSAFRASTGCNPTIFNQVNTLKLVMQQIYLQLFERTYLIPGFLFAGFHPGWRYKLIVDFCDGCYLPQETFATAGSGGIFAKTILREHFSIHQPEGTDEEQALKLVLEAQFAAAQSAGVSSPEIIAPTVALIDRRGYREISEGATNKLFDKIYRKKRNGRRQK